MAFDLLRLLGLLATINIISPFCLMFVLPFTNDADRKVFDSHPQNLTQNGSGIPLVENQRTAFFEEYLMRETPVGKENLEIFLFI